MIDTNDIKTIMKIVERVQLTKDEEKVVKKLNLIGRQMDAQEKMREELNKIREEFENL